MSLLLLGPRPAVLIAMAGAWTQCTYRAKRPYPRHRTVFSVAAEGLTMIATGAVYLAAGGGAGPFDLATLAKPLVGSMAAYFVVNTGLVAGAIALSTGRGFLTVWLDDFLWSGPSYLVAGTAGALTAVILDRGELWTAMVMLVPPIYLTHRTYGLFIGRLEDQKQHIAETRRLHDETIEALNQARRAEKALADEKERLAVVVSDMKRLEEMRQTLLEREQSARESAEEANRLKDQFLAVVSHELRTPLTAILGWAEMLRSGKIQDGRRDRALQAILDSAKRQSGLVEELLDVARIMSGKLGLDQSVVDFEEVVRGALQVVQPMAEVKQIEVSLEADSSGASVYGDGSRLQQIAWNLLSNAIKFTPERGTVRVCLRRAGRSIELVVTDTGAGISKEFLSSVFAPFSQADASTTRRHGGLGLGLAIVKHLVEAHGGTITASSGGVGRGATFAVRLPVVDASHGEDGRGGPSHEQAAVQARLAGISVLVVDDDAGSRDVVTAHLESELAHVLTAESAAQAFELLTREHVDVLLADIAMPEEDGYSLIRRIRALEPRAAASIPAAAFTSCARDEDRQEAFRAGFQLHLVKPLDARSLVDAVLVLGRPREGGADH
jgi:signal transduction histidine kinase/ActR/RegA family two-component response regulator